MSEGQRPTTVTRLQGYLRWTAQRHAEVVGLPPFTIFLPRDATEASAVAIPDTPAGTELPGWLPTLPASGVPPTGRRLRFAFLAEFAPDLAQALQACGYEELSRQQLLVCGPETLRRVPAVPGLTMVTLDARSPLADVREGLDANERGFDPQAVPTTDAGAEVFRRELIDNRAFTARLGDNPVGAAMFTPPHDGIAELVGITTLTPYRRRGIAAYLTGYAARAAFALGVELVYLRTGDPGARRVYDRLGFLPHATHLTFGSHSVP